MQKKKNKALFYGMVVWTYMKYQLLTKTILFLLVFPGFKWVLRTLLESTGRTGITSGDYLGFLFSLQGFGLLMLSLVLVALLIGVDIHAFIIMSALIRENKIKLTARQLLVVGIRSLKFLLKPAGIGIVLYIALVIPLVGVGLGVSVTKNFQIPNFITDVIFRNTLYSVLYLLLLLFLTILTIQHSFFFHYLLIEEVSIGEALKKSRALLRKNWKSFGKEMFLKTGLSYILLFVVAVLFFMGLFFYTESIQEVLYRRVVSVFTVLLIAEGTAFLTFLLVPFFCFKLTNLFYQFREKEGERVSFLFPVEAKDIGEDLFKRIRWKTKFSLGGGLALLLFFNLLLALFGGFFFEEIFRPRRDIEIVAHRGGGDLGAENTISGLLEAISAGASWSEIDIQRTKDGHYIINHDPDFYRVSGVRKSSSDMNLEEIQELEVKDLFLEGRPSQPVATLEEFLDASRGKIGLFLELKGKTADEAMADDVIRMVKERKMEKEVALLSLDYALITYIEETYPEISTGYLYFFAIGDLKKLNGDILIMEEREATPTKIDEIHSAGKKAIVWTVNTEASISKFLESDVDGVITDYVLKVKAGKKERESKTDLQVIMESLLE